MLSAGLLYGLLAPRLAKTDPRSRGLCLGLFFGAVALLGMLFPVHILSGVAVDGRVVVVAVAASLGGPWTAAVAAMFPVIYRLHIGGIGSWAGVGAIVGGAILGVVYYRRVHVKSREWGGWPRLTFGLLVAVQSLLWTFALPLPVALEAFLLSVLPVLIAYPLGCALLGTLVSQHDQRTAFSQRLQLEIQEKERTEASLRESESRFRALAEHIQEVFWISDVTKSVILYVSPAYAQIWGRTPQSLYDNPHSWIESIEAPERQRVQEASLALQTRGGYDEEYPIVRHNGEQRWIHDRAFPVTDEQGSVIHVVGVAEDITHRKAAELALRANQERLRAIIEHSVDGLCVAMNNRIVLVNPAFVALLGNVSEGALIDQPALEWADANARQAIEALLFKTDRSPGEAITIRRDGPKGAQLLEIRAATYGDDPKYTLLVMRDITAQNRLEEQLRQAQKMEAIGQLAGGIAHDFNNLLAAIGGNASLIEMGNPDLKTKVSLQEIGKAVNRAKRLVAQILSFSRRRPSERQTTKLAPVVDEAVALLRATIPPNIELITKCEPDASAVMADPSQIHQVILNLVTNAWHAIREAKGAGRVEVHLGNVEFAVPSPSGQLAPGRYVSIRVVDNGTGIAPADLPRVFDPFFTTKRTDQGTGLGLSVVHGIVVAHGGEVEVSSQVGKGTTVQVWLPAVQAQPDRWPSQPPGVLKGEGQRILFVDDEEALVAVGTNILSYLNYRAEGLSNAQAAIDAFAARPHDFDLVISDMNMPEASGLELAAAVLAIRPGVPIILTSGFFTETMKTRAQELGVKELLNKPGTIDEMAASIHRALAAP